jgi:hypothetical protein
MNGAKELIVYRSYQHYCVAISLSYSSNQEGEKKEETEEISSASVYVSVYGSLSECV